jgi:hypothetical protein
MAGLRRAVTYEILAAQLVEGPQEIVLIAQPSLMTRNDHWAIAINANAKRISPFAAASDIDAPGRDPVAMLIENLAHRHLHA